MHRRVLSLLLAALALCASGSFFVAPARLVLLRPASTARAKAMSVAAGMAQPPGRPAAEVRLMAR